MASTKNILQPLIRSNIALLSQKIGLLDVLVSKNNNIQTVATKQFAKVCPYVNASIGQHYRHSLDHIELAALVAQQQQSLAIDCDDMRSDIVPELHYDLRVRGGTLESDLQLCRERIVDIVNVFESLQQQPTTDANNKDTTQLTNQSIKAYFNLSSTSNEEIPLRTTIGRELGFVIHHSIHHMAMCKVIALHTLKLTEDELPIGFGKAPSTLLFDKNK